MNRAGFANCSCPDFTSNGGACKHLWALRLIVDGWVQQCLLPFPYHPTSLDDAQRVLSILKSRPEPKQNAPQPNAPHATIQHTMSLLTNIVALQQVAVHEPGEDPLSDISSMANSCDATGDDNDSQTSEDPNGGDAAFKLTVGTLKCLDQQNFDCRAQDLILLGLEAVATQNEQHVEHAVSTLLPRLHGSNLLLAEAPGLAPTALLTEFQSVIKSLCGRFDSLNSNMSSVIPTSTPQRTNISNTLPTDTPQRRKSTKRIHDIVLPPSPEPRQKRKVSHGVM